MRKQAAIALVIAAVAVVALAVFASRPREERTAAVSGPLFAGLEARLDQVRTVSLVKAGGGAVTLSLTDDGWGVVERDGYPADTSKLRRLLLDLAGAKLREAKTKDPAKHHFLGVQDLDKPEAEGIRVRLADAEDKPLAELIIGKQPADGGYYVRKVGEDQSWLVDGLSRIETQPDRWLRQELLGLEEKQIREIALTPAKGKALAIGRDKPEDLFRLIAPAGAEVPEADIVALARVPAELRLDDVRKLSEPLSQANEVVIRTFDGLALRGQLLERDGEFLSSWRAEAGDDQEAAKAKAAELNRRLADRAFVIPAYQARRFQLQPNEATKK